MVYYQVDGIDKDFQSLAELEKNGWKEKEAEPAAVKLRRLKVARERECVSE